MVLTLLEKRFKSLPFLSPMNTDFGQQHGLAGTKPTPPWAALAQASHFDVKILLAGVNPSPPCRLRAGTSRQHCRKVSAKTGFGSLPNPITADCPKALQTTLSKAVDAENRVR